jgi:hypothetical protein
MYCTNIFIFIPLSGVGTTCFSLCCACDKDSAIIFTTGRLLDVNPPLNWVLTTANAGTNGLTCPPKHIELERILVIHPLTDLYELCLVSATALAN